MLQVRCGALAAYDPAIEENPNKGSLCCFAQIIPAVIVEVRLTHYKRCDTVRSSP
jgi:hypothetical protein